MPQIISTTVYTYDELPTEQAKEKARNWFTEGNTDNFWAECVLEQWKDEKLPALGFDGAEISYSGFSSQGDGASFVCSVDFLKYCEAFKVPLRPMVRRLIENGTVNVSASIFRTSHYYSHENTVSLDFDIEVSKNCPLLAGYISDRQRVGNGLIGNARSTMREIYRELEKAYDYETSEENVAENIRANEYTFTAEGKRFG